MPFVFAVYDCGFVPRCALEVDDSGEVRFEKIQRLIAECRFGIHDISRTELDKKTRTPRFNMPLELGVFLGAKRFGSGQQRNKRCLVLDRRPYRYQVFISDIAGHDIRSHDGKPETAIRAVRDWLNSSSRLRTIPGGHTILTRFQRFERDLPEMCRHIPIKPSEMTYSDYARMVSAWLQEFG